MYNKKQLERDEAIRLKVERIIESKTEDAAKIKEGNELLNLLYRWQTLKACKELCRLGLWGRVVHLLPLVQYPDIEPTEKNVIDFLNIELSQIDATLDKVALP